MANDAGNHILCDNSDIHDKPVLATEVLTWTCMAWGREPSRTAQTMLCTSCADLFAPLMAYGPSKRITA